MIISQQYYIESNWIQRNQTVSKDEALRIEAFYFNSGVSSLLIFDTATVSVSLYLKLILW